MTADCSPGTNISYLEAEITLTPANTKLCIGPFLPSSSNLEQQTSCQPNSRANNLVLHVHSFTSLPMRNCLNKSAILLFIMHMDHAYDEDNIYVPPGFQGRGLFILITDTAQLQSKM